MFPRQSLSLCVLLLVLVSLAAGLSPCPAQDPGGQAPSAELPKEVVATVNGRPITEAQVVAKLLPR
ncbi:MAG: hypothetical protein KAX80_14865 [Planctomycetes bacterium]|nr:hypothetical protein [Planctomycetota bacterium]